MKNVDAVRFIAALQTMSGFLNDQSLQGNGDRRDFFANRAVRIYPGFAATFVLRLVLIATMAPRLSGCDMPFSSTVDRIVGYGTTGHRRDFAAATAVTALVALWSWHCLEGPCLRLKRARQRPNAVAPSW